MMKNKDVEVKTQTKNSVYCDLTPFDPGFAKKHDFVEVTEWANGEGFDVLVESTKSERFSLSLGQFEAVKHLVKKLNKL